jgi:hypothetical protein
MTEAAAHELRVYMARAEARLYGELGFHFALPHIPIPSGLRDVKNITLEPPISALETAASSWINALMRFHLDQLTIKFSGTVGEAREVMNIGKSRQNVSAFFPRAPDTPWLHLQL